MWAYMGNQGFCTKVLIASFPKVIKMMIQIEPLLNIDIIGILIPKPLPHIIIGLNVTWIGIPSSFFLRNGVINFSKGVFGL